jgi:hypothetical protein
MDSSQEEQKSSHELEQHQNSADSHRTDKSTSEKERFVKGDLAALSRLRAEFSW